MSGHICRVGLLMVASSQIGCVALSIPSQRWHDPADRGGVFGSWTNDSGAANACGDPSGNCHETCVGCGPLPEDPLDPSWDPTHKPKQDEVPWPRFHPVPTRPVLGS